MDRFTAYRAFDKVGELKSFSKAAKDLKLANSTVSKVVRQLEQHLSVQLVVRTTRQVTLTPAGKRYREKVREILAAVEQADLSVEPFHRDVAGELRLALPMSLGLMCISPHIHLFQERHPDVSLDLQFSDAHQDLIAEGLDLAIRGTDPLPDSSYRSRRVAELAHVICASPDYLDTVEPVKGASSLSRLNWLIYSGSAQPNVLNVQIGDAVEAVPISGNFRSNNSMAILDRLLTSGGVAVIPELYARDALNHGRLVEVGKDIRPVGKSLFAIYPPGSRVPNRVRAFIDFTVEVLVPGFSR